MMDTMKGHVMISSSLTSLRATSQWQLALCWNNHSRLDSYFTYVTTL